jgi:transcription initiation factor TFIIIB Brf1 subunit/transcription initiation factor TFIIB
METRRTTMNKIERNHILSRIGQESILSFAQKIWRNQHSAAEKIALEALNVICETYQTNPAFFSGKSAKGIVGGLFYLLGHRYSKVKTQKEIARSLNATDMTIRASYREWLKEFPELFQDVNDKMRRTRKRPRYAKSTF